MRYGILGKKLGVKKTKNLMELPEELKKFIKEQNWIFANTYAKTWPHEYIVQERVNNELYLALANHIDQLGYGGYFYKRRPRICSRCI